MNAELVSRFARLWAEHFPSAELPLAFFFSDAPRVECASPPRAWRCFFASLGAARAGHPLAFGVESLGCEGVKRYAGFVQEPSPDIDAFLSCGAPGVRDPIRLKASPELARASRGRAPRVVAGGRYLVAKRWDRLEPDDGPAVITFFVRPDALAGLVALASFDRDDDEGAACPAVAGCAAAFGWAYAERDAARPRCFVGGFDFTPRQWMAPDELTFSAPFARFEQLVDALPRTFVTVPAWRRVIGRATPPRARAGT